MLKALFTDIDGTLFTSELTISEKTRKAIRKAHDMGVLIVLSSGRYITGMRRAQEQLDLPVIYAAINGALIKDGDEYIRENMIDKDAYRQAAAFLKGKASSLIAFTENRFAIDADDEWYFRQNRICGDTGVRMDISDPDEVERKTGERPYKILLKDNDRDKINRLLHELDEMLEGRAKVLSSGWNNIEVLPYGNDKQDAVRIIADRYSIKRDEIIAFGDWDNDAGMIKTAGIGVAMANGSDKAKAAADYVTLSNDDDGIAHALERYLFS